MIKQINKAISAVQTVLEENTDPSVLLSLNAAIQCLEDAIHDMPETCDHQHDVTGVERDI